MMPDGLRLPADIGLPSQLFAGEQLAQALDFLAAWTRLVEIDSVGLHTVLSPRNRRAARESGLAFTVHGPFGADLDPGSVVEAARRATVDVHRRHAEAAADIGASCYVVHPDGGPRGVSPDPGALEALRRTLSELEQLQASTGVRIAVENMPAGGAVRFSGPGDLELGKLGLALDCGHAAISGTLDAFLENPHAQLVHVHLHSNAGPSEPNDPHRPLGEGVVDAAAALALARTAGATVILEHGEVETARASVAHLAARGLLPQSEDIQAP